MNFEGKQLIDGRSITSGTEYFYGVNRASDEEPGSHFFNASVADIDLAAAAAKRDFAITRQLNGSEKADFLDAIALELEKAGPQLIEMACLETALSAARIEGELGRTKSQIKLFSQLLRDGHWVDAKIDTGDIRRKPVPRPDIRSMQRPIGPVAVFGASNFPLAFSAAGGDTVSAIAAGCPVVFKAHPGHPATCEMVGKAIVAACAASGMPSGYFSLLQGENPQVGVCLTSHPAVKAIAFTGSFRVGRVLYNTAAARPEPIPVFAEMGSTNPVFVLPQALQDRGEAIAAGYVSALTLGQGQFCTNPGLMIHQSCEEEGKFHQVLRDHLKAAASGIMLTPAIGQAYRSGVSDRCKIDGLEILARGPEADNSRHHSPLLFKTSLTDFNRHRELEEELFGPSGIIITAASPAEMMVFAESLSGHLTAAVHGTDEELPAYKALLDVLEARVGRLIVNGYPTGVEVTGHMVHGGPYPATTDARSTSVGSAAIYRFTRPVCYQDMPQALLHDELKDTNPLGIWRYVNSDFTIASL